MLKEKLSKALAGQDQYVKDVIEKVVRLEQQNISLKRPHLNDDIDRIITAIAKRKVEENT